MIIPDHDFTKIDVMEELSASESSQIIDPRDLNDRIEVRRNSMTNGIPLPYQKLDGRFSWKQGEVTLFGGYSGHNKSTIITQCGLHAAKMGFRVGVASLEMPPEDIIETYAGMAAGNHLPPMPYVKAFNDWAFSKLFIYDRVDQIKPHEAIQLIIALRKFWGCDLIILDCLMMLGVTHDLQVEAEFFRTVASVAKQFSTHVIVVHHSRKPDGKDGEYRMPGKYDFIGSSMLANTSANVVITWMDKKKTKAASSGFEVDDSKPDLLIDIAKQRSGRFEGAVGLWQHNRCRAFCDSQSRRYNPLPITAPRSS